MAMTFDDSILPLPCSTIFQPSIPFPHTAFFYLCHLSNKAFPSVTTRMLRLSFSQSDPPLHPSIHPVYVSPPTFSPPSNDIPLQPPPPITWLPPLPSVSHVPPCSCFCFTFLYPPASSTAIMPDPNLCTGIIASFPQPQISNHDSSPPPPHAVTATTITPYRSPSDHPSAPIPFFPQSTLFPSCHSIDRFPANLVSPSSFPH